MRGYGLLALTFSFAALCFVLARIFGHAPADTVPQDEGPSVVSLVRNASWNTEYAADVPFQKADELQYYYIIRSDRSERVRFDFSKMRTFFDVKSVTVDGRPLGTDGVVSLSGVSTVRIDAVAKDAGNDSTPEPSDWLVYKSIGTPVAPSVSSDADTGALVASGASSGSGTIPDHPTITLLENELPLDTAHGLDPRTDHLLRLSGKSSDRITSVAAGDRRLPVRVAGDERFVTVPARAFAPGAYFVAFEYDSRFLRPSDLALRFADYPDRSVEVHAVTPDRIPNDHAANIVLQGRGFDRVVSIQLNNTYILKSTEFTRINDRVMVVEMPEGLDPGSYFLNIMLPNEIV
jgi:hypothetical protein